MKNSEEIFLEELKKEFVEKLVKDVEEIRQAFQGKDMATISRIAHDIKGTIGIFGYHDGTFLAQNLQLTAETGNWEKSRQSFESFMDYLRLQEIID